MVPSTTWILVVDDEPGISEVLLQFLGRDGYEAKTAASGQAALEEFRKRIRSPDRRGHHHEGSERDFRMLSAGKFVVCLETAVYPEDGTDPTTLIQHADGEFHQGKMLMGITKDHGPEETHIVYQLPMGSCCAIGVL